MAVKIRLARHGAKKHPVYRVVVADGRCTRDGRYIEQVGRYNPNTDPSEITLDLETVADWMAKGVAADDAGKVIGRQGRVIKSIRVLARAAACGNGNAVEVELVEG